MKTKIAIVVSSPMTVKAFLQEHIRILSDEYEVTVIANISCRDELDCLDEKIQLFPVNIKRKISLWYDLKAFFKLLFFFRKAKFSLVHSVTPKAGLLAMSAAFFAGVNHRVHTFTGQVWVTKGGMSRAFLKKSDQILALFTRYALVDSTSQQQFLIDENVLSANKSLVLADGSISGVNINNFATNHDVGIAVRRALGIPIKDTVFLFLGRLNQDKGILNLVVAFRQIATSRFVSLLVVGPDEDNLKKQLQAMAGEVSSKIFFVDYTDSPQNYMNAADVFCLPSYREGFGSVIIEAAAVGIPAIGSNIYGIVDAIVDGKTGLLHEVKNINDIAAKMIHLVDNAQQRKKMGQEAKKRAHKNFSMEILSAALLKQYKTILKEV
jgi:glycosyltransferase involved in cell wall biosynthesis